MEKLPYVTDLWLGESFDYEAASPEYYLTEISGLPFGYTRKRGKLSIDENEVYTVRAIYSLYIQGNSMDKIANDLNNAGVPSKNGGKWYKSTIYGILHNPLYAGYVRWDGILRPGDHGAIIELETYEKVNGRIQV